MAKQEEQAGKERKGKNRTNRIGTENERSLHAAVKKWYAQPGDELEVYVDGYIVDLVRAHARGRQELIEIQTKNFSAIAQKLDALAKNHRVRLVYPLPVEKWIIRTTATGEFIRRRKSPKKGKPIHLFTELIRAPDLLGRKNLVLEILLTRKRRSGARTARELAQERCKPQGQKAPGSYWPHKLKNNKDLLGFLPEGLATPFSNKDLASLLGEPVNLVRMLTYSLRKCGLSKWLGKTETNCFLPFV